MKVAYCDLIGGASGDMFIGSLIDAGLSISALEIEINKLGIHGYNLKTEKAERAGVHGTHLTVVIESNPEVSHTWGDFLTMIDNSALTSKVKSQSISVFRNLAEAEKRAHRNPTNENEQALEELGSLDTIIDIVGTVAGFQLLGIDKIFSSPIPMGSGLISSHHGILPASAPATLELIAMAGAPIISPRKGMSGELVTPTGAALLTSLAEFSAPEFHLQSVGYGLGNRNPRDYPNALSLWIGEQRTDISVKSLILLETNIDDMNSQIFGYVQEKLFAKGALDVWFTAIQMKKGRPGVLLSVLLPKELEAQLTSVIFSETSTLGIRTRNVSRFEAERQSKLVSTVYGDVSVKIKYSEGKPVSVAPEYEDCSWIAQEYQIPLSEIMRQVGIKAWDQILGKEFSEEDEEDDDSKN